MIRLHVTDEPLNSTESMIPKAIIAYIRLSTQTRARAVFNDHAAGYYLCHWNSPRHALLDVALFRLGLTTTITCR
jgi:hypothetical protein